MLKKKAYMLEEKYLVVGAGKSGVAACNLLQKKGLKAILYDMKEDMDFTDIQKNIFNFTPSKFKLLYPCIKIEPFFKLLDI